MVKGLDVFRDFFAEHINHYVLIGGSACSIACDQIGAEFRATKDLDLVLTLEALDADFVGDLWKFVREGGYKHLRRTDAKAIFYRFDTPENNLFPAILEMFAQNPGLELPDGAHLTPIPWDGLDQEVRSLSAILMNKVYYQFVHEGKIIVDNISTVGAEHLIPLKAKAWLDNADRKAQGEAIKAVDITKHRSDILRLTQAISPDVRLSLPGEIAADLREALSRLAKEGFDPRLIKVNRSLTEVIDSLGKTYLDNAAPT